MGKIEEQAGKLAESTQALGRVGLLVVEPREQFRKARFAACKELNRLGYRECGDYLEIMDALSSGERKIFYTETKERLHGCVFEIAAEFEAGLVSLADRSHKTGLKTASFNPTVVSFIIVMNRGQAELSHPRLFEYINLTQSI